MIGPALVAQQLPGKQHVLDCHRSAVGETSPRIEMEDHVSPRVVRLDPLGDQPVERERLIEPAREQTFDHVSCECAGTDFRARSAD